MRAWRIYPHTAAYAQAPGFDPLDGAGGREVANRWNEAGNPIIYASATPSLAALETLANLPSTKLFRERTILEIDLEDDVEEVSLEMALRLREDAPREDPEARTREFGTAWLKEKRSLALLAPSFVLPYERNVLINPLHPKARSLRILRKDRIRLDQRLLRDG